MPTVKNRVPTAQEHNRGNGKKKSLSGKTQGIWFVQVVHSLILKIFFVSDSCISCLFRNLGQLNFPVGEGKQGICTQDSSGDTVRSIDRDHVMSYFYR